MLLQALLDRRLLDDLDLGVQRRLELTLLAVRLVEVLDELKLSGRRIGHGRSPSS
jgi:hypothetical protein